VTIVGREPFPDRRGIEPPHGFEVMTGADLDDEHCRPDRWLYIGRVGRRSCIRAGFKTHEDACRAAWLAFDGACAVLAHGPTGAGMRAMQADPIGLPDRFTIPIDSWAGMTGDLLAQIVRGTGSIRRASKVIDVPRSTLSAWVRMHRERGTWPE
jgi:hypothetical protein